MLADCWLGISNFGLLAMAVIISHESLKLESLFLTSKSSLSCSFPVVFSLFFSVP